jgi:hypothetical protein
MHAPFFERRKDFKGIHRNKTQHKMPQAKKAIRYFCQGCTGNPYCSLLKKDVARHQLDTGHRGIGSDLVNAK